MIVVKAFGQGLNCRGYQYHVGLNVCEDANCVRNGFHAAEDPLDCLDYYESFEKNEFWLCDAGGDMDMDSRDTKVSCTELTIIKRLDLLSYVLTCLRYMQAHPKRKRNKRVCTGRGEAFANHFVIVEGDSDLGVMTAKGHRVGDVLGFLDKKDNQICVVIVSGQEVVPGKWYNQYGEEIEDAEL